MQTRNRISGTLILTIALIGLLFVWLDSAGLDEWVLRPIEEAGPLGFLVYIALFVLTAVFLLPISSMLSVACGFVFGMWPGFCLGICAISLSCAVQWFMGSRLLGGYTDTVFSAHPLLHRLDHDARSPAFWFTFLARLSPVIPMGVLNLAAGARRLPIRAYVVGTLAGIVPSELALTYLGSVTRDATALNAAGTGTTIEFVSMAVGIAATIGLIVWGSAMARRAQDAFSSPASGARPGSGEKNHA